MEYKVAIHNELISQLSGLVFEGTSALLWKSVKKVYMNNPTDFPVCRVLPVSTGVTVDGDYHDTRTYRFEIATYELIDNSADQTEAETKIDRLSNIEDSLYKYIEVVPNSMEHAIPDIHIYNIDIAGTEYNYANGANGVEISQSTIINLQVTITPQLL